MDEPVSRSGALERTAAVLTAWSTRWLPDTFLIAVLLTALAGALALALGRPGAVVVDLGEGKTVEVARRHLAHGPFSGALGGQAYFVTLGPDGGVTAKAGKDGPPLAIAREIGPAAYLLRAWGTGFFDASTLAFAVKMALIMLAGWILAQSRPVGRLLDAVAGVPGTPRQAILVVALASMSLALVNWGLSLVASAVLVRAIARRVKGVDYPLLVCSAYLGVGCVWHAGFSASAPLLVAAPKHALAAWCGVIPLDQTILSSGNVLLTVVVFGVLAVFVPLLHPAPERTRAVDPALLADAERSAAKEEGPPTPAARLEQSPLVSVAIAALLLGWVGQSLATRGFFAIDLNAVILFFFALAFLLHLRPRSFLRAAESGGGQIWGIILQFPFYGGIAALVDHGGLGARISEAFTSAATAKTYPLFLLWYSGILNYVVPSGSAKILIEASYIFDAGRHLGVTEARSLLAYVWGDMLTNVIQPFWAIPLLAVARLEFRDIMGYAIMIFMVYAVVVSSFFFFVM